MQVDGPEAAPRTTGVKRVHLAELVEAALEFRPAFAKRVRPLEAQPPAPPTGFSACAGCHGFGRVKIHTDELRVCPLCHGQGWFIARRG